MNVESLERNYIELQELKYVLQYTDEFFLNVSSRKHIHVNIYVIGIFKYSSSLINV